MRYIITILTFFGGLAASMANADGLPLPWPYPWAKECPINWKSVSGRYTLVESSNYEELEIQIAEVIPGGPLLAMVTRLADHGKTVAEGFSLIMVDQRILQLDLVYTDGRNETKAKAWVKLYHGHESIETCNQRQLVPILTLQSEIGNKRSRQYRLIKVIADRDKN